MKLSCYPIRGFHLLDKIGEGGTVELPVLAAITIHKGDYITPSGGYATNTATDTATLVFGIAAEDCDNSAGASGAKSVKVIPLLENYRFYVPVGNAALVARANVGVCYDLHTAYQLDLADAAPATHTKGFLVEDFDASAGAIDGNAYGYAIGRFVLST